MHRYTFLLNVGTIVFLASTAFAKSHIVNVPSQGVGTTDSLITVSVSLPNEVVGRRVDRAFLEVLVEINDSAENDFDAFPILELFEIGSEMPKQTVLLPASYDGVVRVDVTRFVREWSGGGERAFGLGRVSDSNGTAFGLGANAPWEGETKARLVIQYSEWFGESAATEVE